MDKNLSIQKLTDIPNIGPAMADDFRLLGIISPEQLKQQNGYDLYNKLCRKTKTRHDPCVIDTFLAAVDFMNGAPKRPWWHYTKQRKADLKKNPNLVHV